MIDEHDRCVLTEQVEGFPEGTVGVVVYVYEPTEEREGGYEIEVTHLKGPSSVGVFSARESQVRPLEVGEFAVARRKS